MPVIETVASACRKRHEPGRLVLHPRSRYIAAHDEDRNIHRNAPPP
jgi:hypothetical protein